MKQQEVKALEPKEEKKVPGKSKQKDVKDEGIKDAKEEARKGATKVEKMEVEAKKEKKDAVVKTAKSFRPSSTPPAETGKPLTNSCFLMV